MSAGNVSRPFLRDLYQQDPMLTPPRNRASLLQSLWVEHKAQGRPNHEGITDNISATFARVQFCSTGSTRAILNQARHQPGGNGDTTGSGGRGTEGDGAD